MEILSIDRKSAIITDSPSVAKNAYIPKGLSNEQIELFNQLKSISELSDGALASKPSFVILGRVKFLVTVNDKDQILGQRQIFGVVQGEKQQLTPEQTQQLQSLLQLQQTTALTPEQLSQLQALLAIQQSAQQAGFGKIKTAKISDVLPNLQYDWAQNEASFYEF